MTSGCRRPTRRAAPGRRRSRPLGIETVIPGVPQSASVPTRPAYLLPLLAGLALVAFLPLAALWVLKFPVTYVAAFVAAFLLLEVYLPYRVYADERSEGSGRAARWAAVVFLLPLVGFLLYLVVRGVR